MDSMVVGYKLTDGNGSIIKEWGGTWGQCPDIPNPLLLPNGIQVCGVTKAGPVMDGYSIVEWVMDKPEVTPDSITPRQCRLMLEQQGRLADIEQMIAQSTKDVQITWEYALEFKRNDPLLNQFAANLGLSQGEIDQFFTAAAKL